ncbi:unnamed protein product [Paramecium octaurelia]|uniref:Transmembrane protein n=1 Tax=Paramecium octaurelia TaxID=43137 RepID=A0A8S1Y9L0_PAROT|nr:unnamed protein product [Paramecium octaurelia]
MKSSLVTENGRRTKTTPDQSSLISYSSRKSCLSSERKTQVKATCKVLCEMREDQSSKLAVKFTQLQIVLATQSIIQVISKFRSAKLQTYFWILLQDRRIIHPSPQNHSIESISLPQVVDDWSYLQIQNKTKLKQRHHNQSPSPWILMQVLNKIKQKQQRSFYQLMNQNAKICQGTLLLRKFIKKLHNLQKCSSLLCIVQFAQNYQNCSLLDCSKQDSDSMQIQQQQQKDINIEEISIKEQLAIKFASTTILASLLNSKHINLNFYFFLNFLRCQQNKSQFIRDVNLYQGIEVSQVNYDQSSLQENQQVIAAQNLHSFLFIKLQNYFQAIKIFHLKNDYQIAETMNTMIINKHCDLSNSFEDLNTQRILVANFQEEEIEQSQVKNSTEQKKISSFQNITEIEESTKSTKAVIVEEQQLQPSLNNKKKKKKNNKIKNAIKQYCSIQSQSQRRLSNESMAKTESFGLIHNQEVRKLKNATILYTAYISIVVIIIVFILFLK